MGVAGSPAEGAADVAADNHIAVAEMDAAGRRSLAEVVVGDNPEEVGCCCSLAAGGDNSLAGIAAVAAAARRNLHQRRSPGIVTYQSVSREASYIFKTPSDVVAREREKKMFRR